MDEWTKRRDEQAYATNLLTLRQKDEADIAEARERVDANEK